MWAGIPVYGSGGSTPYIALRDTSTRWGSLAGSVSIFIFAIEKPCSAQAPSCAFSCSSDESVKLFVDANGAYAVKQSLALAKSLREFGVDWFEEPVSSDNLVGLAHIRKHTPDGMDVAAGEYGYTAWYFDRMLSAGGVDVCRRMPPLRRREWIPRCGFLLRRPRVIHMEFFHDHARLNGCSSMDFANWPEERCRPICRGRGGP